MKYLRFQCSRRGPGYHYALGHAGYVPETLAREFLRDGAAKEIPVPADQIQPDELAGIIRRHEGHVRKNPELAKPC